MTRAARTFNFPSVRPPVRAIVLHRTGEIVAHVRAYTFARAVHAYTLRTYGQHATQLDIAYTYRQPYAP